MAANIITLRISGTKVRKAGFSPLVAIGILPPAEEHNLDRSLQVAERPGFILKQTPEYILYNAVDCKVRPVDDDAPGRMSIALSIPANMQLAGGASPYDLLMEVYTFFRNNYMSPLSDGRDVFINTEVDPEPFRAILGRYSLEERKGPYTSMTPSGATGRLRLVESKLADFFRDSQYPEFGSFKEIEIGTLGESSPSLEAIHVPRPKVYRLKINGVYKGDVSNPSESLPVRAPSTDTEEFTPVTFTINELLENGGILERNGATIRLNPSTETISCDLERKPITFRVRVNWMAYKDSADMMRQWMENGDIAISQGSKDYTRELLDGSCRINARNARAQFVSSKEKYRDHIIKINQIVDLDKREVVLTFDVKQERRTIIIDDRSRAGGNGGGGNRVNDNRNVIGANDRNKTVNQPVINDVQSHEPARNTKGEQQRAFFFGILVGFILGLAGFYALNEFVLKDKQAETDGQTEQNSAEKEQQEPQYIVAQQTIQQTEDQKAAQAEAAAQAAAKEAAEKEAAKEATEKAAKDQKEVSLDELKKQLVDLFKKNQWNNSSNLIDQTPELAMYKQDLNYILRIRQRKKVLDSNGKEIDLTEEQLTSLKAQGFFDGNNGANQDMFEINDITELSQKKKKIESLLSAF
ncbi:MAG: hypothetical protein K2I52_08585 [Muribaculaceae bacterium]|nr:hypothetical protein [Muribaculaceae bacterium]